MIEKDDIGKTKDINDILKYVKENAKNMKIMATSGFGPNGIVLLYHIKNIMPELPIYFIDTKMHFKETIDLRNKIQKEWKLNIIDITNENCDISPQYHHKCCYERKVIPLEDVLKKYDIWISSINRGQTESRENIEIIDTDTRVKYKVNPLTYWSESDIWSYINILNLPYNDLHNKEYKSIGCAPCTSIPPDPNDPRSGRWKDTYNASGECGIHGKHKE